MQGDNVAVLQLLEERGLSDGREGRALLFLKTNLFQGNDLVRQAEEDSIHLSWFIIRSLSTVAKCHAPRLQSRLLPPQPLTQVSSNVEDTTLNSMVKG